VGVALLFGLPFWLITFMGWWVGGALYALLLGLVGFCAGHEFVEWRVARDAPNPERDWNTYHRGG